MQKRTTGDPLEQSLDRLTEAFSRLADRLEGVSPNGGRAAAPSTDDAFTRHVRRYMPFYALAAIFALFFTVLPTRNDDGGATTEAGALTEGSTLGDSGAGALGPFDGTDGAVPAAGSGAGAEGGSGSRGGVGAGGGAGSSTSTSAGTAVASAGVKPLAWNLIGKTRGGFDCKNGVRQIPWSDYAVPCYPAWSGTNPGATSRGVTAKEIVIVNREFPESANSQAVAAIAEQAGAAPEEVTEAARDEFRKYFNKIFELWGRKVKFIDWESQFGDSTAEAQGRGKEGACADANVIVNELKAFAVVGGGSAFSECAAERKLIVLGAAAYYPERWYDKYHPYVWNGVMDCERISEQLAEYMGKRLANRPAKWAKQLEKGKPRKFGVYVPNNDEYQYCTDVTEKRLKEKYNTAPGSRYNYTLDISRFPDEAAKGIIQFKAAGVTTVVLACDPFSPIFLTQSAKSQNYYPEWFEIGTALNDVDNVPRLWDADEIRGSLFGLSQLGSTEKLLGPESESVRTYKAATGTKLAPGTTGEYHTYMGLFSILQATGPNLTPENMAKAYWSLPPGGAPRFEVGYISYRDGPDGTPGATDHTGIDDSREIWWDHNREGFDGEMGSYVETYNGKRFRNGEWPREEPPIYPPGWEKAG